MMLLAIETSGTQGSIAVFDGSMVRFQRILQTAGTRHAQTLPAEVADVFRLCELKPTDIRFVAVSIGPGSFTGLRVGLTFAKTFAWLNDAKLVAVDTLRAIAQQVSPESETVTAIVDAQRSEYFAGTYRWNSETGLRDAATEVYLSTLDELNTEFPLVGPPCGKLGTTAPGKFCVVDESLWQPHAVSVGQIALHRIRKQEFSDPDTLEPVYIRLSYAEEKRTHS